MSLREKIMRNIRDGRALGATFPLRHVSRLLGRKYHVTNIKGAGTVRIRPKSSDPDVFLQIFANKDYDLSRFPQLSTIMSAYQSILNKGQIPILIDAGANIGAASIWFSRLFPRAHILAIEPDADNVELCRMNTGDLPNVKVIAAAVGSTSGHVSLNNPTKRAWSVETIRDDGGNVTVLTVAEIVSQVKGSPKLFLVKIDIEGFEDDLFAKNTEWVNETDVLIVEPHDWKYPGKGTSRNLQKVMAERDFELLISGENLVYVRRAK